MANGALLADPFPVCADVLVVVTAEASQRVEVTDDVAMREPIDMHLREARVTEDLLQCGHGTVDRRLLRREDGGLIRSVIGGEVVGYGLASSCAATALSTLGNSRRNSESSRRRGRCASRSRASTVARRGPRPGHRPRPRSRVSCFTPLRSPSANRAPGSTASASARRRGAGRRRCRPGR